MFDYADNVVYFKVVCISLIIHSSKHGGHGTKHSATGYVRNIITYNTVSILLSELSHFIGMNY